MRTSEPYRQTFFDVPELMQSISLPAGSPARTSALPAKDSASSEENEAACGVKCSASSVNSCRVGCSLRMFLLSELAELTSYSLIWNRQATPSGRSWWVLGRLERRTSATGCGSSQNAWNTPRHSDGRPKGATTGDSLPNQARNWPTARANDAEKRGEIANNPRNGLPASVIHWPTPNKCDADRGPESRETKKARGSGGMNLHGAVWSTPAAQDSKNDTLPPSQEKRDTPPGDIVRSRQGQEANSTRGKRPVLNGRWVLQLMGYPSGWCDLPTSTLSSLLATRSCRKSSK